MFLIVCYFYLFISTLSFLLSSCLSESLYLSFILTVYNHLLIACYSCYFCYSHKLSLPVSIFLLFPVSCILYQFLPVSACIFSTHLCLPALLNVYLSLALCWAVPVMTD